MVPIEAAGMEQSLPDDPETEAAERAQKRQKLSIDEVPSDAMVHRHSCRTGRWCWRPGKRNMGLV